MAIGIPYLCMIHTVAAAEEQASSPDGVTGDIEEAHTVADSEPSDPTDSDTTSA